MKKQVLSEMQTTINKLQDVIDELPDIVLAMDDLEEDCDFFDEKIIQETEEPMKAAKKQMESDWNDRGLQKEYEKYYNPHSAAKWRQAHLSGYAWEIQEIKEKVEKVIGEYQAIINRGGVIKDVK